MAELVGFRLEVGDRLGEDGRAVAALWNRYMEVNKNAVKKRPFEFFLIGTDNPHQRRNFLYFSYIVDAVQFIKELMLTEPIEGDSDLN